MTDADVADRTIVTPAEGPVTFACKLCRGTRYDRSLGLSDHRRFTAVTCSDCGLFQVLYDWTAAPPLRATAALDFATTSWDGAGHWHSESEVAIQRKKAATFADMLARTGRLEGASVLDVGCGEGQFLDECRRRGAAQVTGQEFRMETIRLARERSGVSDVRTSALNDRATWPAAEFDIVCSFDVLEHVHDVADFMRQCARLLKPGGFMLHATPGADSLTHLSGRLAARCGATRLAATLCNVQSVSDLLGGPHVHVIGKQQVDWLARELGFRARTEYVASYSYSDEHYAAVVPQLAWMPRPIGAAVFAPVRKIMRNKLVIWLER